MKVKNITPVKSATLCKTCKFSYDRYCKYKHCYYEGCERREDGKCICTKIDFGQPCPYFEKAEEEAQQ